MIGFIKPDVRYDDCKHFLYGIITDTESVKYNGHTPGPVLGETHVWEPFEAAEEALRKLGCDSYQFIPLYPVPAEIYPL